MLTPRLTNCPECANIPDLLKKIDCKLAEYANGLYNNVVFMLNQVVPAGAMIQLLAYKRILTYKQCNPDYLADFCMDKIVSKVIRLTLGCYIKPTVTETLIPTTTSTTSTSTTCPPLICSFDGTGVSSCSFTGTVHKVTITPTTTSTTSATPTTSTTSTTSSTSTSTTSSTTSTTTSTSSTTTTTTTAPPTLRASIDISPSPQCDGSVLVTVRPDVNAYVNITSSFAPGGGAVYLAGLPVEVGVTNIYSNLSDDVVNAGITKKYRFGISAYRYTSGIGNIYTSNIYIVVRDAVDDSLLADYVFYRTHIDQQC